MRSNEKCQGWITLLCFWFYDDSVSYKFNNEGQFEDVFERNMYCRIPFSFHLNRLGTWSVKNSDVSWKCFKKDTKLHYLWLCKMLPCYSALRFSSIFSLFLLRYSLCEPHTPRKDSFVVVWGPRFSFSLPRHSRSPCEVPSLIYCDLLAENIDPMFLLIRYHDKLDSVLQLKNICLILIDCNFFYLKDCMGHWNIYEMK